MRRTARSIPVALHKKELTLFRKRQLERRDGQSAFTIQFNILLSKWCDEHPLATGLAVSKSFHSRNGDQDESAKRNGTIRRLVREGRRRSRHPVCGLAAFSLRHY
jgi:hypothetical protein